MEWLSLIADVVGISAALIAAWQAYKLRQERKQENKRQDSTITVSLQSPTHRFDLPVELRRREFNRAEILGRIGMIPLKDTSKRFVLRNTNTREFLKNVNVIIDGQGDSELVISCTHEELEQFDLERFKHLLSPI
jgi:hypothetical protein